MITPSSTIAAQLNIGTGVALAFKLQKKKNIVVALSGERDICGVEQAIPGPGGDVPEDRNSSAQAGINWETA